MYKVKEYSELADKFKIDKSGNSIGLILFLLAMNMAKKEEKEKLEKIGLEDFVSKELEF